MQITRVSLFTGQTHTREIDVTPEQLALWQAGKGGPIQLLMPHISPDDREFLMTGIPPEEWDEAFGSDPALARDKLFPDGLPPGVTEKHST